MIKNELDNLLDEMIRTDASVLDSLMNNESNFTQSVTESPRFVVSEKKSNFRKCTPLDELHSDDFSSPVSSRSGVSPSPRSNSVPLTPIGIVKASPRARSMNKKVKQHSTFCHLCSRPSVKAPAKLCTRTGCYKVVCLPCFNKFQNTFVDATENAFVCSHCSGTCLDSSRCQLYLKSNADRKQKRILSTQLHELLALVDFNES